MPETRQRLYFILNFLIPQASSSFFFNETRLPMSCPPKHTHTHRRYYESIQNVLWEQLTKGGTCQNFLTTTVHECCNGVSSRIPHILHCVLAVFTTLCGLGHLATLLCFSSVTKGQFTTLLPPFLLRITRHIISSHQRSLTKVTILKMSGQAGYGCIHERGPVTMEL